MRHTSITCAPGLLPILLVVAGCSPPDGGPAAGEGMVIPVGQVLKGGSPYRPSHPDIPEESPGYQLVFVRIDGTTPGDPVEAIITDVPTATFTVNGVEGRGIEPGKYRVAVVPGPGFGRDPFEGKYTLDNSPIEIDVKEGEELIIDLDKY